MFELQVSDIILYSDYVVLEPKSDQLIFANLLDRSRTTVQSAIANIYRGATLYGRRNFGKAHSNGDYSGYIESFQRGKTKYHQGIIKSDLMYSNTSTIHNERIEVVIVQNENQKIVDVLFETLYSMHDLPLKSDWKFYIFDMLQGRYLRKCMVYKKEDYSYVIKEGTLRTDLANWDFYRLSISTKEVDEIISNGIRSGQIEVTELPQKKIEVSTLDDYFQEYGKKVIGNVMKGIKPLFPRIPNADINFNSKSPFPVQAEIMNGVTQYLKHHRYAIIVGQMGVGKTFMSTGAVALAKENSRNIVMGPGIMLEKWKEEILSEIPNSKAKIVSSYEEVTALRKLKKVKPNGREFYIFSKDFLKLSYEQIPIVKRHINKSIPMKVCKACNTSHYDSHSLVKCTCGSTEFNSKRTSYRVEGVKCEACGEIVFPNRTKIERATYKGEDDTQPLTLGNFSSPSNKNYQCSHCGEQLWQPNVQNYTLENEYSSMQNKSNHWMKIKVARNKSNKTYVTQYITKKRYEQSLAYGELSEKPHSIVKFQKSRKYSPAEYMKKYLGKNFFDFGIFDECHQFKSGSSAQGNAFGQILKTAKRSIAMTGTISGGVASDLFYLLFRLDPKLLLEKGYSYGDYMKFASDYGVVEEVRIHEDQEVYFNRTSKGRQDGSKRIKPGISPLLFSEFLISNTFFVDLSDFEAFMVKLTETPVGVQMEKKQEELYKEVQNILKDEVKQKGGQKLLGQVLPTLMSLPDAIKIDPMIHPTTGSLLYSFDFDKEAFYDEEGFLNKEKELLRILRNELDEGRNCFVYCEYTSDSDKNITERLKTIIENELSLSGQVDILKASSPSAQKRMSWIKEKAAKGTRVFITNPKLVEVGLDFIFKHQGQVHNFPTIIFFQVGYNLQTVWQSASRHLRLIQHMPCRTYYLYYKDTLQEVAITALGSKKMATTALQGTFSAEGLSSMANSVDPRVLLADALMNGSKKNDIEEIFDKVNNRQTKELSDDERLLMEKILAGFRGDSCSTKDDLSQLTLDDISEEFCKLFELKEVTQTQGKGTRTLVKGQLALAI